MSTDPTPNVRAILFADISDSSRLYRELGDAEASRIIRETLDSLTKVVTQFRGDVIDRIGDELMCSFADAEPAADAAVGVQEESERITASSGQLVAMRVGFHVGEVLEVDGRYFGDCVYAAKRLTDAAKGGQIVIAEPVREALAGRYETRLLDTTTLKGQADAVKIHELLWNVAEATRVIAEPLREAVAGGPLSIEGAGRRVEIRDGETLSIGRGAPCDLIVQAEGVSRLHAKIEGRKNKFVLVDVSTNGSYVLASGARAARFVHRDDLSLPESGIIGLGAEPGFGGPHVLSFLRRSS